MAALGALAAAGPAQAAGPCPRDGAGWTLSTSTYDTAYTRHAYVGNGYLSQRVPPAGQGYDVKADEKTGWPLYTPPYDGAFVGGLYGADPAIEEGRTIDAAIPTWSTLELTVDGETLSPSTPTARISGYRQSLYLGCGLLHTQFTWTTASGKATDVTYDVLASRNDAHVGAVHVTLAPKWAGQTVVTDRIDGRGARRLTQTGGGAVAGAPSTVAVAFAAHTANTDTTGTVASTLTPGTGVTPTAQAVTPTASDLSASDAVTFKVTPRKTYELTKFVGVDTSLTSGTPDGSALAAARQAAAKGWTQVLDDHNAAWGDLWKSDIQVANRPELQDQVRSNLYALWSSIRAGTDTSIAPTGLSSDNYAGLIFWDAETWMYPSLLLMHPNAAESVIEYRRKTLPGALRNAQQLGYKGSFFPWNGAGTGDLWQECHSWNPPHCITQIHLQGDIALATWQYYLATGDKQWLASHWSLLRNIAEFWVSRVTQNRDGTYSITNVAGPDEYSNGVDDGVFTNAGAATALRNATTAAQVLGERVPASWTQIANHLRMPFDATRNVFLQYDGYQGTVIKQADTVLLIYPMEWPMSRDTAAATLDYYAQRTDPDGPAMTDAIHAIDSAQIGEPGCATNTYLNRSIKPFVRDPFAQFAEARGDKAGANDPLAGSPAYDFLTGSGGFAQVFTYGLTGLRWRADRLHLDPMLPPQLADGVTLTGLRWQGRTFDIRIGATSTTVTLRSGDPFALETPTQTVTVKGSATIPTRRPDLAPTTNVARCRPATATSEEPGMYAEAAVDGSAATIWAPVDPTAGLTVDLGTVRRVSDVTVDWTDTRPASSAVELSSDGTTWTAGTAGNARYVRVTMTRATGAGRTGIREVDVTG